MKKILSVLLLLVVLFSIVQPAFAALPTPATPQFTYINSISADISIDPSTGKTTCYGFGRASGTAVAKVVVTCSLQYKENGTWHDFADSPWSSSAIYATSVSKTRYVYKGYTYRVFISVKVYDANDKLLETGFASSTEDY